VPLPRPTPRRPTPIATPALQFSVYLDAEGVRKLQAPPAGHERDDRVGL